MLLIFDSQIRRGSFVVCVLRIPIDTIARKIFGLSLTKCSFLEKIVNACSVILDLFMISFFTLVHVHPLVGFRLKNRKALEDLFLNDDYMLLFRAI